MLVCIYIDSNNSMLQLCGAHDASIVAFRVDTRRVVPHAREHYRPHASPTFIEGKRGEAEESLDYPPTSLHVHTAARCWPDRDSVTRW